MIMVKTVLSIGPGTKDDSIHTIYYSNMSKGIIGNQFERGEDDGVEERACTPA